jgi:type II secretion system protein N
MIRRLALAAAALVALVLVVIAGLAYWLLSGDGVRVALERQASAWLGHPVRIGRASARILPRIGIQLQDVRIGEPVRMTLEDAAIATDFRALLSRRVENADLIVSNSRIELPLPTLPIPVPGASDADEDAGGDGIEIVSVRTIALRDIDIVSRGRELLVSAESHLEGSRLTVSTFHAQSGQTELEAEGVVELSPRVDARLRVTANRLDVDELLALADAFTPERAVAAPATGRANGLPGRIAARVSAESARAAGVDVRQFATDFEIDGSNVSLAPLSFQLFGGRYEGSLNARLGEEMTATLRSRLMDLDVAQLAAFGGVPDAVTGRLTGAGTFTGQGADMAAVLSSARGQGTAQMVDGTIQGLNLVRTVVLFFGRPAPDAAAGSDRFNRVDATYTLSNGTFRANAFSLQSPDADIVGSGTLHIPTKALDGQLDLSLSEELSAQAGTDLVRYTREGNRVVLPARISGTISAPRLTIDAAAAVKRGLRNEVERRLKGLLGGFGGGGKQGPAEPEP